MYLVYLLLLLLFWTQKSTAVVARSLQDLCELMQDLPDYADHFVNMICKILQEYLDSCHSAYQGIKLKSLYVGFCDSSHVN